MKFPTRTRTPELTRAKSLPPTCGPARRTPGPEPLFAEYGDRVPALYWHAWAEVRVGRVWIPLDPTFGQPVADATHVALGGGTRVDTVGLLGSLEVVAVEVAR